MIQPSAFDFAVIDKLCTYLECSIEELLEHTADSDQPGFTGSCDWRGRVGHNMGTIWARCPDGVEYGWDWLSNSLI